MPRSSFSKNFFKLFPPPAYLDMPYAGIDISDDAIHCLQFKKSSGKSNLEICKYAAAPLAPGSVEAGYIKDEAAVTAVLAALAKKFDIVRVKASLPEEKVYLFRTHVPSLNPREISQNIESKLDENVPLAPADAIFHFKIIPTDEAEISASVSVVPIKVVETYLRVFKAAGISVLSFEMQARALAHALVKKIASDALPMPETVVIVYGMNKKIGVYVVYRGIVCFTSTISIEADIAQDIFKQVKEVVGYWMDHGEDKKGDKGKRSVDAIMACGSSELATAVEATALQMNIPFAQANVWSNAFSTEKYIPSITAADAASYAVAVGLALPVSG